MPAAMRFAHISTIFIILSPISGFGSAASNGLMHDLAESFGVNRFFFHLMRGIRMTFMGTCAAHRSSYRPRPSYQPIKPSYGPPSPVSHSTTGYAPPPSTSSVAPYYYSTTTSKPYYYSTLTDGHTGGLYIIQPPDYSPTPTYGQGVDSYGASLAPLVTSTTTPRYEQPETTTTPKPLDFYPKQYHSVPEKLIQTTAKPLSWYPPRQYHPVLPPKQYLPVTATMFRKIHFPRDLDLGSSETLLVLERAPTVSDGLLVLRPEIAKEKKFIKFRPIEELTTRME